jgi:AcrR family transcriptional regulator
MNYTGAMDKRQYVQRDRAAATLRTRERILDAARESLRAGALGAVKVDEVARTAGVARSTVYLAFGSRAGLFGALAEDLLVRVGFDRIVAAFREPDARIALLSSFRAASEVYAAEPRIARALWTLAAIDPDAVVAVRRLEHGRWPGMLDLARRLFEQGHLRPDTSTPEAADLLWILTSFTTFDQLFGGRELPPETVAERLAAMAERALLRPVAPDAR